MRIFGFLVFMLLLVFMSVDVILVVILFCFIVVEILNVVVIVIMTFYLIVARVCFCVRYFVASMMFEVSNVVMKRLSVLVIKIVIIIIVVLREGRSLLNCGGVEFLILEMSVNVGFDLWLSKKFVDVFRSKMLFVLSMILLIFVCICFLLCWIVMMMVL